MIRSCTALMRTTAFSTISKQSLRPAAYTTSTCLLQARVLNQEDEAFLMDDTTYKRPTVQWYPGHIAKAERQLAETLKAVDVVVEVRDARACRATSHDRVGEWCAGKPRIVVLTHVDQIPKQSVASWKRSYQTLGAAKWDGQVNAQVVHQAKQNQLQRGRTSSSGTVSPVDDVLFVNAKQGGQGIFALHRAIYKAGQHVLERRTRRGLKQRALRVGCIGYPNVGKSALINSILGKRRARTANTPGITKTLQWIRVRNKNKDTSSSNAKTKRREFELLDSPGVIPAKMVDQSDAILLAAINCIGNAAYDNQAVAAYLCEYLQTLHVEMHKGQITCPDWPKRVQERYGFDPLDATISGEDMVYLVADKSCQGSPEDASRKILQDFRQGRMGPICLQLAPQLETDEGQERVVLKSTRQQHQQSTQDAYYHDQEQFEAKRLERAQVAMETAKQTGLELPPMIEQPQQQENDDDATPKDVGKGLFDGW